jgi:Meckel syndrome type 1 protein
MQPDDEVTKRYRGLAREEPSAAVDAAILAASRRALRPSAARRWSAPVSIAAVLVLAFGLTLEMRHEEPGIESSLPARPASVPEPARTPAAAKDKTSGVVQGTAPTKERYVPQSKPVASSSQKLEKPAELRAAPSAELRAAPSVELRAAPSAEREAPAAFPAARSSGATPPASIASPVNVAPPPATAPAPQRSQQMNAAPAAAYAPRAKAQSDAAVRIEPDPAARELDRIAELRAEGRDAEADKALEAFRRDHPDYRIPEAMWERVKPR